MIKKSYKNPKFSIIIPASRSQYIETALESVITQKYPNSQYEIIISDNSEDGFAKKIKKFKFKNLKYYKTDKYLTVEKNWEIGFNLAQGEWQLMLCDDDVLDINCLQILSKKITKYRDCECFLWNYGYYWEEKNTSQFSIPEESNTDICVDSKNTLKKLFGLGNGIAAKIKPIIPFFPRAVFSKNLVNRIKKENSVLMIRPEPQTGTGVLALIFAKKIIKIQKTLTILFMNNADSASNLPNNQIAYKKMIKGFDLIHVPIKSHFFFPSLCGEILLSLQHKFDLKKYKFNFCMYFVDCLNALKEKKSFKEYDELKKIFNYQLKNLGYIDYFKFYYLISIKKILPFIDIFLYKIKLKKQLRYKSFFFENGHISFFNKKKTSFINNLNVRGSER